MENFKQRAYVERPFKSPFFVLYAFPILFPILIPLVVTVKVTALQLNDYITVIIVWLTPEDHENQHSFEDWEILGIGMMSSGALYILLDWQEILGRVWRRSEISNAIMPPSTNIKVNNCEKHEELYINKR